MSKGKVELVTGDDVILIHDIEKENDVTGLFETFDVPIGSTVRCRLVSMNHDVNYTDIVSQLNTNEGADWSISKIAVKFTNSDTLGINSIVENLWKQGKLNAKLETQIDDNAKNTYFATIVMVRGSIG